MLITLFITFLTFFVSMVVMTIASTLAKKMILDREKMSSYECGFDPKGSARLPFSLRFFLIAIIFLIFDIEITLILPISNTSVVNNSASLIFLSTSFLIILLLGLYYEWFQGMLEWS